MPLIAAFGRERQEDLLEFEASLLYIVSSRTARDTWRNPVLKNKINQSIKQIERILHTFLPVFCLTLTKRLFCIY